MYQISTLNQISVKGLERFSRKEFEVASNRQNPDGIMVRSHKITPEDLESSLKGIARAGAGVDKICVDACTEQGIPVFNTPGANANSVKELVMLALLLSSRGVVKGINFVKEQSAKIDDAAVLHKEVEKGKKHYAGNEVNGKTLGIVGLGAIGSLVAEMAIGMGMTVLGYDPGLSVESAWRLSNKVQKMDNLQSLLSKSDYVTLHLPMLESTKYMINADSIQYFKEGARLMNFSREGIVNEEALLEALDSGKISRFVADFPYAKLACRDDVILLPHLGASTEEAEDNCAVMAADQLIDFLKNGNIKNSVNFPNLYMERSGDYRLAFSNANVPGMLQQVLAILEKENINVIDMTNKSRGDLAYTVLDVSEEVSGKTLKKIRAIEGIKKVYTL